MKKIKKVYTKFSAFTLLALILPTSVFAGGPPPPVINFALPTAVPTLSGTMLVILSLLLFMVAFRIAKQKNANTGKFFITLLGITAIASGTGGIKIISDVNALVSIPAMDIPIGGKDSRTLQNLTDYRFTNGNTQTLTISIIKNVDYTCGETTTYTETTCVDGPFAPNTSCDIRCELQPR